MRHCRLQAYPSLMWPSWKSILLRSIARTRKHLASTLRAPLNSHDLSVQSVLWLDTWSLPRLAISKVLCCNRARLMTCCSWRLNNAFCKTSVSVLVFVFPWFLRRFAAAMQQESTRHFNPFWSAFWIWETLEISAMALPPEQNVRNTSYGSWTSECMHIIAYSIIFIF